MKGKNSNRLMKLGVLTLVVSIISCSMVGGAFAKYTTTVSGTDTARVAKFAFDLKDTDGNSIMQQDGTMKVDILDLVDEDAVMQTDKDGNPVRLVAPGTKGSFTVEVENQSEVAVTTAFRIDERQFNGLGEQISGKADPVLDEDGNPLYNEYVPATKWVPAVDEAGNPILDDFGNQLQMEVPVLDDEGNQIEAGVGNPIVNLDSNGKLKTNGKVLLPIVYFVDLGTDDTPDVRYYSDLYIDADTPITVGGETITGDLDQMSKDMVEASGKVLMWQDSGVTDAVTARTYTVNWQWAFEGDTSMNIIAPLADGADGGAVAAPIELQSDMMDTALGINMAKGMTDSSYTYEPDLATGVEVTVNVIVSQVDELPAATPDPVPPVPAP